MAFNFVFLLKAGIFIYYFSIWFFFCYLIIFLSLALRGPKLSQENSEIGNQLKTIKIQAPKIQRSHNPKVAYPSLSIFVVLTEWGMIMQSCIQNKMIPSKIDSTEFIRFRLQPHLHYLCTHLCTLLQSYQNNINGEVSW